MGYRTRPSAKQRNRLRSTRVEMPRDVPILTAVYQSRMDYSVKLRLCLSHSADFWTGKLHTPTIPSSQGFRDLCCPTSRIDNNDPYDNITYVTHLQKSTAKANNLHLSPICNNVVPIRATITQFVPGSPRKPSPRRKVSWTWDRIGDFGTCVSLV